MLFKSAVILALGGLQVSHGAPYNTTVLEPESELNPRASGQTYFTADGYGDANCGGNKFWSYEVSWGTAEKCLSEKKEIRSVWVHNYGNCPDGKVRIIHHSEGSDCTTKYTLKSYGVKRGDCLNFQELGGAVFLVCDGRGWN